MTGGFDAALARTPGPAGRPAGGPHWLVDDAGRWTPLPVQRWHGPPEPAVRSVIGRCAGPTLDVGCGPGRLTAGLVRRGVACLGIDTSAIAVRLTRHRGGPALRRDVFQPLPGEGRWSHVLLMDGNIGIGGDPVALLRRCATLLRPGGTVHVELDRPGLRMWTGQARLAGGATPHGATPHGATPFRWARLGAAGLRDVADRAGLTVRTVHHHRDDHRVADRRWFAELERS